MNVIITYETLFDILRKEKSREELQELADDFYLQAFAFIKKKMSQTNGDFFEKGHIQLRNTKKILKELFERRERKIINLAIDSARTESMLVNKDSMTPKEKMFFEDTLNFVKLQKMKIIGPVLTGVMPKDLPEYNDPNKPVEIPKTETAAKEKKVEEKQTISSSANPEEAVSIKLEEDSKEKTNKKEIVKNDSKNKEPNPKFFGELKVKITTALPKFLGPDGKVLGPFNEGQETTLPEKVARILEKKGKAEVI